MPPAFEFIQLPVIKNEINGFHFGSFIIIVFPIFACWITKPFTAVYAS